MIKFSVGEGGKNATGDVLFVQFLIVDWLVRSGHPDISIDGLCGPRTKEAILSFQKQFTTVSDGRADPKGPTIKALQSQYLKGLVSGKSYLFAASLPVQRRLSADAMIEMQDNYFTKLREGFG